MEDRKRVATSESMMPTELLRLVTARLGRRRQVDADRPAALRHEADHGRPARAHRGDLGAPRRRLRQPRAADRRPARRARAGDHDRRRLPLVRDARAGASSSPTRPATSSTRATWSPAPRPPTSRWSCSTRARASSSRRAGTSYIASILGIPHVVVAVNKMDLVDFSQERFAEIEAELRDARRPGSACHDLRAIPISALRGDNVVDRDRRDAVVRRADAARAPRDARDRGRPQPRRAALPGAVGDPADDGRAPRLPRLRGPGRRAASGAPATRSSCCRPAGARASPRSRPLDGPLERGGAAACR